MARARVCRTPKYLVELYQASTGQISRNKQKGQEQQNPIETNFLNINEDTHLDVSDFIEDPYYNLKIVGGSETVGEPFDDMAHPNV